MTVYVDPLFAAAKRNREGFQWSHMVADSADELRAFAEQIGIKPCWRHGSHYDVWPSARARAVAAGAVEVSRRRMVEITKPMMLRAITEGVRSLAK